MAATDDYSTQPLCFAPCQPRQPGERVLTLSPAGNNSARTAIGDGFTVMHQDLEAIRQELGKLTSQFTVQLSQLSTQLTTSQEESKASFDKVYQDLGRVQEEVGQFHGNFDRVHVDFTKLHTEMGRVHEDMGKVHEDMAYIMSEGLGGDNQGATQFLVPEKLCAEPLSASDAITKVDIPMLELSRGEDEPKDALMPETKAQEEDVVIGRSTSATRKSGVQGLEQREFLRSMFLTAEKSEQDLDNVKKAQENMPQYLVDSIRGMNSDTLGLLMDSVMAFVICVNAVFIGISMDFGDTSVGWLVADSCFSLIFVTEICIKVTMFGWYGHFCGSMRFTNCFDAALVTIDLFQLTLIIAFPDTSTKDLPSASLFRVVRLVKLARLLRLFRTEVFKDLISMIQGMLGGMTTLMWSMALFFIVVYVVALLFREFLGREQKENISEYFDSVPRSMFTTYRCCFGDCSSAGGVPIFEHVNEEYGAAASIFYCLFVFGITIGLFNVISAIFVESTMAAAEALATGKKQARLADKMLWDTRITTLVKRIMDISPDHAIPGRMSESVEEIYALDVRGAVIDEVVMDPTAKQALDDLDIDPHDHNFLSDILDPDNGGSIGVGEFVDGLRRLRGDPRRSDIITIDLMVRSIQKTLKDLECKVTEIQYNVIG